MNILGALYAGTQGILKAKESMDLRAGRIAQIGSSAEAQEALAEDLVGMELDEAQVKASSRVIQVSSEIFHQITHLGENK